MRVRKLTQAGPDGLGPNGGPAGDMTFGRGAADYWINDRRGVGQLVSTRLRLWQGQWFLAVNDGMPWGTEVLGKYTDDVRDAAVQDRIYATPGMVGVQGYNSQLDRQSRAWTVHASLQTVYGEFVLKGPV
jgi:hypothetical protein